MIFENAVSIVYRYNLIFLNGKWRNTLAVNASVNNSRVLYLETAEVHKVKLKGSFQTPPISN